VAESAILESEGLRLLFERRGDRYVHRVEQIANRGQSAAAVTSVEGPADAAWPNSPPFQELHIERRGERRIALLVGRAGGSHWSASVQFDVSGRRVEFDVACRVTGPPDALRSTYDVPPDSPLRLVADPIDGNYAQLIRGNDTSLAVAPQMPSGPWPATVRWRYSITV
jgi:hypothetical protein